MNKKVLICLCIFFIFNAVLCGKLRKEKDLEDVYGDLEYEDPNLQKDEQDYPLIDNDENTDITDQEVPPAAEDAIKAKLLSKPQTFTANIGDTVFLPCLISASKSEPVRLWTKETQLLFQSIVNMFGSKNLHLWNNGTLAVTIQSENDAGNYECKLILSSNSSIKVGHKVEVFRSPKIESLFAAEDKTLLSLGDDLTLTCRASGVPKPKISWHKGNQRLGTEGETLIIESVLASDGGSYRCLADNKIGSPAHKPIEILIEHAPIINVEKFLVNSDHEKDAELVCNVDAYPPAAVTWQKDNFNLVSKEPKITLNRQEKNRRNVLIIRNLEGNDFGKYTCVAVNSLGKQNATIQLVKRPVLHHFNKSISADNSKDLILEWKVESKQPVSTHELQYRRKGQSAWNTLTPELVNQDNDVYLLKQTLMRLDSGTYETRARSKNSHGWSEFSDIMAVDAKPHHHKNKHNKNKEQKIERAFNKESPESENIPAQQRTEEVVKELTSSSQRIEKSVPLIGIIWIISSYFQFYYH